jgi:hypothetical protein
MTRTEIRDSFNRNKSSSEISRALILLQESGLARMAFDPKPEGQVRQAERWMAITPEREIRDLRPSDQQVAETA